MPNQEGLPIEGDIIMSTKFACAERSQTGTFLMIINHEAAQPADVPLRRHLCSEQGGDAYDRRRKEARFTVERTEWVAAGVGSTSVMWYVSARRMNSDGTYNHEGERICFFLGGSRERHVLSLDDLLITTTT